MGTNRTARAIGALVLSSIAALPVQAHRRCHLIVDHAFIARVIDPVLRQRLGQDYPYYDPFGETPIRRGNVLMFYYDPTRTVGGSGLMSETTLVIQVDACSGTVLAAYDALPPRGP
jgi:hypothetical protein